MKSGAANAAKQMTRKRYPHTPPRVKAFPIDDAVDWLRQDDIVGFLPGLLMMRQRFRAQLVEQGMKFTYERPGGII